MAERTLVLIKPDAVQRGLAGEVIGRIEHKKLRIVDLRMLRVDERLSRKHYEEHLEKTFYPELEAFITSAPLLAMAVEGEDAITVVRDLIGATDPKKAAPGTIRGDYGLEITRNLVHGSDSPESAKRELDLFFPNLPA